MKNINKEQNKFDYYIENKETNSHCNINEEKINKLEEQLNNINNQLSIITELLGNINNIVSFRYSVAPFGKGNDQTRQIVTIPYNLNYYKEFLNNEIKQNPGFAPTNGFNFGNQFNLN